jgi:hypothetical protein
MYVAVQFLSGRLDMVWFRQGNFILNKKNGRPVRTEIVHLFAALCPIYIIFLTNEDFCPSRCCRCQSWLTWCNELELECMLLHIFRICLCVVSSHIRHFFVRRLVRLSLFMTGIRIMAVMNTDKTLFC